MKKRIAALFLTVTGVAWLTFIFSNSAKSRVVSSAQSAPLENLLKPLLDALGIEDTKYFAQLIVRKGAHITEFFVLTLICVFVLYLFGKSLKESLVLSSLFGITAACADELIQIFSHRGAKVTDVFIDSIGVALAVLLFWLISKKIKK